METDGPTAASQEHVGGLVHSFVAALTLQRLYGAAHPRTLEACARTVSALGRAAAGSPELVLGFGKDRLFIGAQALVGGRDAKVAKFVSTFHHLGVSRLGLRADLSPKELARFLEVLAREGSDGPEALQDALRAASVLNVTLGLLDYTRATVGEGQARPKGRLSEEAIWRTLVLPASQAGLPPLTAQERSELLGFVEEPGPLRELLDSLEALSPRSGAAGAGRARVVEFARRLARLLKSLPAARRQVFISRLAGIVARRQAASGPGGVAKAQGAGRAGEAAAGALAAGGKPSERLRTAYGEVLGTTGGGRRATGGAAASDYLGELLLNRSEDPYMSEGYAQELEGLTGAAGAGEPAGDLPANLLGTLEARELSLERAHLAVELLNSPGAEADIEALAGALARTAAGLIREGSLEEAGGLLESIQRDFYGLESRSHIERVITEGALASLQVAPVLDDLLGRPNSAARQRLVEICRLLPAKALRHLLDRLKEEPGEGSLIEGALAAVGEAAAGELLARLPAARGGYRLRLIGLLGQVGADREAAALGALGRCWNKAVRMEAVRALGAIGTPQAVAALSRVLLSGGWLLWGQEAVRLEAAQALGGLEGEEAEAALLKASGRRGAVASACKRILARRRRAEAA